MSCVEPRTLVDLTSNKITGGQLERVRAHVDGCDKCRATQMRMQRVQETLRGIAEMPAPAQTSASAARFEATLRWTRAAAETEPRGFFPRRWMMTGGMLAAAAALAVVAGFGLRQWRARGASDPVLAKAPVTSPMTAPAPAVPTQPAALPQAPVEMLQAMVTLVGGDARIKHEGPGEKSAATALDLKLPLAPKDRVSTGNAARLAFQWGEGSGALLEGNSDVALTRLEARAQELTLYRGQISVRVGPHQPGESMRVVSPDHTVTVHGTWFVVAADARGTDVQVLEGVVMVTARSGDATSTRLTAPSRAFFPRERGVAAGERALTGREAASLRLLSEMGLMAWSNLPTLFGATGVLKIGSDLPAQLVVDGVSFGETPLSLRRPRGDQHLVELSRIGYSTQRRWVTVGEEIEDLHMALPQLIEKPQGTPATEEEVLEVLRAHKRQLDACHSEGLKYAPTLAGTVTLKIKIGPEGQVLSTPVQNDDLKDPQVIECVRRAAGSWTFERARNATAVVPVTFRPIGAAAAQ